MGEITFHKKTNRKKTERDKKKLRRKYVVLFLEQHVHTIVRKCVSTASSSARYPMPRIYTGPILVRP